MYLVFTRMPGESYRRRLRSLLLYLWYVFRALINSIVCWFYLLIIIVIMSSCESVSPEIKIQSLIYRLLLPISVFLCIVPGCTSWYFE